MDLSGSKVLSAAPGATGGGNVSHYAYNDTVFQWNGRWLTSATGKWSAWPSSHLIFNVSGTLSFRVLLDLLDAYIDGVYHARTILMWSIDGTPYEASSVLFTDYTSIFTGQVYKEIALPDTGTHEVILQVMGDYDRQFAATHQKVTIVGVQVPSTASVSATTKQGAVNLQILGDSWMAAYNGASRLFDRSHFKVSCIAVPGQACNILTPKYLYDYSGSLNTTDPAFSAIVIIFGVNEEGSGWTLTQFKTEYLALIDTVRTKFPTTGIVMVGLPDKTWGTPRYFSKWVPVLQEILTLRTNTYLCDASVLTPSLPQTHWLDISHLNYLGKPIFVNFVNDYLRTTLGI